MEVKTDLIIIISEAVAALVMGFVISWVVMRRTMKLRKCRSGQGKSHH